MKRIISILAVIAVLAAVLTACGSDSNTNSNSDTQAAAADAVDLNAVIGTVNSQFGLSGLKTLESANDLNRYYEIAPEDVKQFAAELSSAAQQYTEVVLIEANDQTAAGNIKAKLETHLSKQLSEAKSYAPEQEALISACSVKEKGNFVYLVISDKFAEITGFIDAAL